MFGLGKAAKPAVSPPPKPDRGQPSSEEKVADRTSTSRITFLPYHDGRRDQPTEAVRQAMRGMLRDPFVKAAWCSNLLTVVSQDWQIHPSNKKSDGARERAEFVKDIITQAEGGMVAIATAALHPAGPDGYSISEKVWQPIGDGKHKGKVGLRKVSPKHPDRIRLIGDGFLNITAVVDRTNNETHPISDFLYLRYMPMWDEPEGTAPWYAAYGSYWMMDTVRKLRIIHHEKKIGGMLVGTYTDPASQAALEDALKKAKSATWMTIPEDVRVQAMQISTASETEYKSFIEDLRVDIVTAITFASLQILQGSVPDARGDSKVQKGISDLAPWYLTYLLQEVINRQLIPDIIDYNFPRDGEDYPRVTFGAVSNQELVQLADLVGRAQQLGLKPSKKYYAEALSIQEAAPDDPADALTPPGMGGSMGMPGIGGMPPGMGGGGGGVGMSPFGAPPSNPSGDPASQGGQPMGLFSERGQFVDKFAWHTGERGGKYWLPEGQPDIAENRLYGEAAKAAATRERFGPSGGAVREVAMAIHPEGRKVDTVKFEKDDPDDYSQHIIHLDHGIRVVARDRKDGYTELDFERQGIEKEDGTVDMTMTNMTKSNTTLQPGSVEMANAMQHLVRTFAAHRIPISYAPSDRRRLRVYERVMLQNGYVPVGTRDNDDEKHKIFWQHGSMVPQERHAGLIAAYREAVGRMNIVDRLSENRHDSFWEAVEIHAFGFDAQKWERIDGGRWKFRGGSRIVSDATFQRWSAGAKEGAEPKKTKGKGKPEAATQPQQPKQIAVTPMAQNIAQQILALPPDKRAAIIEEIASALERTEGERRFPHLPKESPTLDPSVPRVNPDAVNWSAVTEPTPRTPITAQPIHGAFPHFTGDDLDVLSKAVKVPGGSVYASKLRTKGLSSTIVRLPNGVAEQFGLELGAPIVERDGHKTYRLQGELGESEEELGPLAFTAKYPKLSAYLHDMAGNHGSPRAGFQALPVPGMGAPKLKTPAARNKPQGQA
jgi:hypothetical protein